MSDSDSPSPMMEEEPRMADVEDAEMEAPVANQRDLLEAYERVRLRAKDGREYPWSETMTIVSKTRADAMEDVEDEFKRELVLYVVDLDRPSINLGTNIVRSYQQALDAANKGRELVLKAGIKFSRPDDYFAEMIKSDEHMSKVFCAATTT